MGKRSKYDCTCLRCVPQRHGPKFKLRVNDKRRALESVGDLLDEHYDAPEQDRYIAQSREMDEALYCYEHGPCATCRDANETNRQDSGDLQSRD